MTLVKSHIQMPKFVLKQFENQLHMFYYYDVKKDRIIEGHSKTLNTQFGYYSLEVERFFNEKVERPFSDVILYLKRNDFLESVDSLNKLQLLTFKYIHALIARGPSLLRIVKENSFTLQFFSEFHQHNYSAIHAFELAQKRGLFSDYFITFAVNKSGVPFVLPTGGLYSFDDIIVAPVTPDRAIILVKDIPARREELIDGNICRVYLAEKDEDVIKMNLRAIEEEYKKDRQYVVSPKKEILEQLVATFKANKENNNE